jgi:hypothetical protein
MLHSKISKGKSLLDHKPPMGGIIGDNPTGATQDVSPFYALPPPLPYHKKNAPTITNLLPPPELPEISTVCAVCGEGGHDELILLCDSENCKNEVHMYCLNPIVTQVPEGDWYCPTRCRHSAVNALRELLETYSARSARHRDMISTYFTTVPYHSTEDHKRFSAFILQQALIPFDKWQTHSIHCMTKTFRSFQSEFDSSSSLLIGCLVRIQDRRHNQDFVEYHSGRILSRRLTCAVHTGCVTCGVKPCRNILESTSVDAGTGAGENKLHSSMTCPTANCPYLYRYEHLVYFKRFV